ncbi:MAG: acyltransferase [Burkholderiales bacterium]|nr:acyltransferase [Phycisphaerae bacterium]
MAKMQGANAVSGRHSAGSQSTGSVLTHMPAIDAVRGIAILLVLVHHFSPEVSGSTFTRGLLSTLHVGWVGVDLFFVLSGFLITAILLKTRRSEDFFLNFYARRTLRIFPLYYIILAVLLLVLPALLHMPLAGQFLQYWFGKVTKDLPAMLDGQSWLWLYGTNLKIAVDGSRWGAVNHFWSLAVEEHFYLAWPLVVYFVSSRQRLARICLVCIFGAPVLRGMMMLAGFDSVVPYVLTPCRVDSLAIGALISILIAHPQDVIKWQKRFGWMAAGSMAGLLALPLIYGRFNRDDLLTTTLGYSLLAVVSAWIVLAAARIRPGTAACRIIANPVFTSLGRYSYGIYVTHMFFTPVYARLFSWSMLRHYTGSYWIAITINLVLSIACAWFVAWMSYHVMEKHFLRLKTLFDYRRPQLVLPSSAPAAKAQKPMILRPGTALQPVRRAA